MMTHEMMQAAVQEQEARISQFHAEQQAIRRKGGTVALSRRSTSGWVHLPSLIVQTLRPAFAQ